MSMNASGRTLARNIFGAIEVVKHVKYEIMRAGKQTENSVCGSVCATHKHKHTCKMQTEK